MKRGRSPEVDNETATNNESNNKVGRDSVVKRDWKHRIRRNVMRNMVLVIDASEGGNRRDFLPDRLSNVALAATEFARRFFDKCPLGRLGLVITREGAAEVVTGLQVGPQQIQHRLNETIRQSCGSGVASLQNALDTAMNQLKAQALVSTREILILWSSSSTADPGDIFSTMDEAARQRITCNIISIGGQLRVLSTLANRTGGTYTVPKHEVHFQELLFSHADAPVDTSPSEGSQLNTSKQQEQSTKVPALPKSFVVMGFPNIAKCTTTTSEEILRPKYECPRCASIVAMLPAVCDVCNITLLSSVHVARSFYSLFPSRKSESVTISSPVICTACNAAAESLKRCTACQSTFCAACDEFIHSKLNNCPGCAASPDGT
ncbi:General transcription factor IIH subunit 2 [Diplonema papillatum]|nr:General transcription factor IIH subunit 2 [Diplonema papillatum]